MKKSFFAAVAVASLSANVASAANFEGLYVGGTLNRFEANQRITYDAGYSGGDSDHKITTNISGLVGYGKRAGNLYTGVEAQITLGKSLSFARQDDGGRMKPMVGANLRVGGVINDKALIYGLVGFDVAHANYGEFGSDKFVGNVTGLKYGLGVDFAIMDRVNARLEYARTSYQTKTLTDTSDMSSVDFKLTTNVFKVGLTYAL